MNIDYTIIIYIILGIIPSLIWLAYYLREDAHPEPKRMILEIFFWGAVMTLPTFFVQIGLTILLNDINLNITLKNLIYWFVVIAFSEEFLKYLVIRMKVVNSRHLDEPLDVMLYMVIAALGFAAVENILYLLTPTGQLALGQIITRTLIVDFVRFIGAIFLHTLCSAVVGYSLAISFCEAKNRIIPIAAGLLTATLLHGLYDFSIINLSGSYLKFSVSAATIIVLALLVFSGFEKLKKMKSICKI
jgi:RsiW-degrading membrane proteinase PrsW (M82 family)